MSAPRTRPVLDVELAERPSVVTAFPVGPTAPSFGLDRPLPLLGGDRIAPNGLCATAGLDHVPGLSDFLANACRAQSLAGRTWHHQPPLALLGPDGVGRGLLARRISRSAGVPLVRLPVSCLDAVVDHSDGTETGLPSPPVLAMAATLCANPIVLLGADRLDGSAADMVAGMIEPNRGRRWLDPALGTVFDVSNVSWILQARSMEPTLEERIRELGLVVAMELPSDIDLPLRRLSVAIAVAAPVGDPSARAEAIRAVLDGFETAFDAWEVPPARDLVAHAIATLARGGFAQ